MKKSYRNTAELLVDLILKLIPDNLEILEFEEPWSLFSIKDFKVADLSPSYAQAAVALSKAKAKYYEQGIN